MEEAGEVGPAGAPTRIFSQWGEYLALAKTASLPGDLRSSSEGHDDFHDTDEVFNTGTVMVLMLSGPNIAEAPHDLDTALAKVLDQAGFTGDIQATLEPRLGRTLNKKLALLGRLLWFDKIGGLHSDNTCGGCHSPTNGFGDRQCMAIGVQNNGLVGPNRSGPRNQRRTPTAINTGLYPGLMWNGRFRALSG